MSSSSSTNPAVSVSIRDGPGSASAASSSSASNRRCCGNATCSSNSGSGGVVQNLINNNSSSSRPREATPLLTTASVDYPHYDVRVCILNGGVLNRWLACPAVPHI